MPYIKQERRTDATKKCPETEGELNWAITMLCQDYFGRKGLNYATINAVVGVLECAKLEIYRRLAANYENKKAEENGDVFLE